ncbi:MAG: ATP-binding protein [Bacteroidales bacterium]|nr:ATP-binding protein [Bacteroidales bacterium]
MERKIEKYFASWKKSSGRMPLMVVGARQVGKTYSILSFGNSNYNNVVYFNFESNPELQGIFQRDLNPVRIVQELSVLAGKTITPENTLLFFDEIQACEQALTSLKYFNEKANEYHIIAAGSLLGVAVNRNQYSYPVGKVEKINMYPLDFEEFLWALDQKSGCRLIAEHFDTNIEFSLHSKFIDLFNHYLTIGGMPQVVKEFIEKRDFNFVVALQKNINDAYVADMAKYATPDETTRIMAAFNTIPAQLAKENRKFQYKLIKTGARAHEFETALDWLQASGVANKCVKITEGKFPLQLYTENAAFKIYLSDNGLLCSKYGIAPHFLISGNRIIDNIKGALTENFVMNSLISNQFQPYYWESQGKAEVDFVVQMNDGKVIPIEVKSSENVRSKSLKQFINKYKPAYSVRVSTKNFGFENGIKSIPLYAFHCLTTDYNL